MEVSHSEAYLRDLPHLGLPDLGLVAERSRARVTSLVLVLGIDKFVAAVSAVCSPVQHALSNIKTLLFDKSSFSSQLLCVFTYAGL